jgi:hypothetical protein
MNLLNLNQYKMKKTLYVVTIIAGSLLSISCGGKKASASEIAKKWCALENAADNIDDPVKAKKAEEALEKFEKEIEEKYKENNEFYLEIWGLYSECSGRS